MFQNYYRYNPNCLTHIIKCFHLEWTISSPKIIIVLTKIVLTRKWGQRIILKRISKYRLTNKLNSLYGADKCSFTLKEVFTLFFESVNSATLSTSSQTLRKSHLLLIFSFWCIILMSSLISGLFNMEYGKILLRISKTTSFLTKVS